MRNLLKRTKSSRRSRFPNLSLAGLATAVAIAPIFLWGLSLVHFALVAPIGILIGFLVGLLGPGRGRRLVDVLYLALTIGPWAPVLVFTAREAVLTYTAAYFGGVALGLGQFDRRYDTRTGNPEPSK